MFYFVFSSNLRSNYGWWETCMWTYCSHILSIISTHTGGMAPLWRPAAKLCTDVDVAQIMKSLMILWLFLRLTFVVLKEMSWQLWDGLPWHLIQISIMPTGKILKTFDLLTFDVVQRGGQNFVLHEILYQICCHKSWRSPVSDIWGFKWNVMMNTD